MKSLASFLSGLVFAIGLGVAGMTQPAKVIGFLDFFGSWDPSLGFVMGGAVLVNTIAYRLTVRRRGPVFEPKFHLPTRRDLDPRLVAGAALFGLGWGASGFCPGPALTSTATLDSGVLVFVAAMVAGMLAFSRYDRWSARRRAKRSAPPQPAGAERRPAGVASSAASAPA